MRVESSPSPRPSPPREGETFAVAGDFKALMLGATGHGSVRVGGASNLWITSLHGPSFTIFGFAWRKSIAVPSSLIVSRKPIGGLAFINAPSSAATSSTESAFKLIAMRLCEPIVLMARGNGETTPLTVGFSNSNALPPPGFFISRSAISVISNSVATGFEMRINSPPFSNTLIQSRNESKAMTAKLTETEIDAMESSGCRADMLSAGGSDFPVAR